MLGAFLSNGKKRHLTKHLTNINSHWFMHFTNVHRMQFLHKLFFSHSVYDRVLLYIFYLFRSHSSTIWHTYNDVKERYKCNLWLLSDSFTKKRGEVQITKIAATATAQKSWPTFSNGTRVYTYMCCLLKEIWKHFFWSQTWIKWKRETQTNTHTCVCLLKSVLRKVNSWNWRSVSHGNFLCVFAKRNRVGNLTFRWLNEKQNEFKPTTKRAGENTHTRIKEKIKWKMNVLRNLNTFA